MIIDWDTSKETVSECLNDAHNTFIQLLEDLNLAIVEDDIEDLFNDNEAYKYIKQTSIQSIKAKALHPSCHNILNSNTISYSGCLVILNDEYILDGNHRFNTLLEISKSKNMELEVPVLFIYKDF